MNTYINLNRKFIKYDANSLRERNDWDYYWDYYSFSRSASFSWEDVLKHRCNIVIAEAGSGKTTELRHMAETLYKQGEKAFFCDITTLASMEFQNAIIYEAGTFLEFAAWQQGNELGYFFFDSVDEARLKSPKDFEIALKKFAVVLAKQHHRAHIVISSRPTAWQDADPILVRRLIAMPSQEPTKTSEENTIQILQLAPLAPDQVEQYARARGVDDMAAFMKKLEQTGAETFMTRPQDLDEQIGYWKEKKIFGQYHEVLEENIKLKLDEKNTSHEFDATLSLDEIRDGVEKMAAAVTFVKKIAILLPDGTRDNSYKSTVLDPKKGLFGNWTSKKINALLSRPIFDEALYGTVRFYHRTVREYLTAKWLFRLLDEGKPRRAIEGLIFKEIYGLQLVVPSMRPIAAWLAGWDSGICQKVIINLHSEDLHWIFLNYPIHLTGSISK